MELANRGVSIVICCFNSAIRLPETIRHIALQEVPNDIPWELIVVNNNSTDNTTTIALAEIQKYETLVSRSKIVDEPMAGLSYARQKGVSVATYEYLVFCDDDNWLDTNYTNIAYKTLNSNAKIGAVGGQSIEISEAKFPDWWDDYKSGYAVGKQAENTGDISYRKYLWGSGLAFKKTLFTKAFKHIPSLLTDRKGNELSSGGDSELCMRFLLMGYQLYYDESLKFKHYIDPNRLTWSYRKQLFQGFTYSSEILNAYGQYITILQTSLKERLIKLAISTSKIMLARILRKNNLYTEHEANTVYYCIGLKLTRASSYVQLIRKFKTTLNT